MEQHSVNCPSCHKPRCTMPKSGELFCLNSRCPAAFDAVPIVDADPIAAAMVCVVAAALIMLCVLVALA